MTTLLETFYVYTEPRWSGANDASGKNALVLQFAYTDKIITRKWQDFDSVTITADMPADSYNQALIRGYWLGVYNEDGYLEWFRITNMAAKPRGDLHGNFAGTYTTTFTGKEPISILSTRSTGFDNASQNWTPRAGLLMLLKNHASTQAVDWKKRFPITPPTWAIGGTAYAEKWDIGNVWDYAKLYIANIGQQESANLQLGTTLIKGDTIDFNYALKSTTENNTLLMLTNGTVAVDSVEANFDDHVSKVYARGEINDNVLTAESDDAALTGPRRVEAKATLDMRADNATSEELTTAIKNSMIKGLVTDNKPRMTMSITITDPSVRAGQFVYMFNGKDKTRILLKETTASFSSGKVAVISAKVTDLPVSA